MISLNDFLSGQSPRRPKINDHFGFLVRYLIKKFFCFYEIWRWPLAGSLLQIAISRWTVNFSNYVTVFSTRSCIYSGEIITTPHQSHFSSCKYSLSKKPFVYCSSNAHQLWHEWYLLLTAYLKEELCSCLVNYS